MRLKRSGTARSQRASNARARSLDSVLKVRREVLFCSIAFFFSLLMCSYPLPHFPSLYMEIFLPVRFGIEGSEAGEERDELCFRLIVLPSREAWSCRGNSEGRDPGRRQGLTEPCWERQQREKGRTIENGPILCTH